MGERLYLGDCLAVMPTLADNSVDAVITDPPFGIGFKYHWGFDSASHPTRYWEWFRPFYVEMLRVLKPGGLLAIWQSQPYMRFFWDWFGSDIHIYCAAKNFVQLRKTPINYGYDPVVMRYKLGEYLLRPQKPSRNLDYFVANTASVVSDPNRPERAHPCPRPLDAVLQILENFALPNGLIFDPFMGSGTTGVACVLTGRHFIGIEREEEYFAIAEKRIAEAQSKAKQLELAV